MNHSFILGILCICTLTHVSASVYTMMRRHTRTYYPVCCRGSCSGLETVLFMILDIRCGPKPCILSRMSSGIQPLPGFFEIWLRDAGAAHMGQSAETSWQTMRRNIHTPHAEPAGLSQRCADGDRTQPDSSVPSSFRQ